MKGFVAAGHTLTCKAAAETLQNGGNAFDAAVAAGFASAVTEPTLSSPGGGGFLLAHVQKTGQDIVFDFFVNTPGKGLSQKIEPHFFPVTVDFKDSAQDFHIGMGSVAVPAALKGFLHVHNRLGLLPLRQVLEPAIQYALNGVSLTRHQAGFLSMLKPIYTFSPFGKSLYERQGLYVQAGDKVVNPAYGAFLHVLSRLGEGIFYDGFIANQIEKDMKQGGGFVTREDLKTYRVEERTPFSIRYRDYEVVTNPLPASGGILISLHLKLFKEALRFHKLVAKGAKHLLTLCEVMKTVEELRQREGGKLESIYDLKEKEILTFLWHLEQTFARTSSGTTHISVLDSYGNAASMTISNGEGSGYYVPGTGIMLNNMLGEDDLYPEGFHSIPPGMRVSSMMSPGFIKKDGQIQVVLGSGGSKRIKT
ncbi:MAG TPA: gamma-glutamyltransferase, partial [Thermodesulfovibrionia bacterium]|nr:gamma-glutamyltransferase [Thermodesulfovibrionia bacterium]